MADGLNATKTPERPSHEALEETGQESPQHTIDVSAMESAKRAQNRIHTDEGNTPTGPGGTTFTK